MSTLPLSDRGLRSRINFFSVPLRSAACSRLCVADFRRRGRGTQVERRPALAQGHAEFRGVHPRLQHCFRDTGGDLHRSRPGAGALQVGAGPSGGRHHHSVWTAPDRCLQDQSSIHGCAPAQRERRQHRLGIVRHRLRVRFWLDAVRRSDPGRHPRPGCRPRIPSPRESFCWPSTRWDSRSRSC